MISWVNHLGRWLGHFKPKAWSARPRIMFLTEGDTACSQLVSAPLKELHNLGEIDFSLVYEGDFRGRVLRKKARESDVLIAFRGCSRRSLKTFKAAKAAGVTTVWSSDDDLLELEATNPVGGRYQKGHIRGSMEWMIKYADYVWVFSPHMQGKYANARPGVYRTNSVAPFEIEDVTNCSQNDAQFERVIKIGHIGDFTHRQEMLPLIEVVNTLTTSDLSIAWEFHFAGYTPEELEGHPNVKSFPYIKGVDAFHVWLKNAGWSIGIAPLRDTTFNACKSDNKFRTFGGLGIAGVYADVPPYRDAVSHQCTGLLSRHTSEDYSSAIHALLLNESLRSSIAENAKRICLERYELQAVIDEYRLLIRKWSLQSNTTALAG
jgi:glycosyltransferase involved in cell wall biosynthesis